MNNDSSYQNINEKWDGLVEKVKKDIEEKCPNCGKIPLNKITCAYCGAILDPWLYEQKRLQEELKALKVKKK